MVQTSKGLASEILEEISGGTPNGKHWFEFQENFRRNPSKNNNTEMLCDNNNNSCRKPEKSPPDKNPGETSGKNLEKPQKHFIKKSRKLLGKLTRKTQGEIPKHPLSKKPGISSGKLWRTFINIPRSVNIRILEDFWTTCLWNLQKNPQTYLETTDEF